MGATPFPKGGGTVHLGYDAWNVRVGSLWGAQPREPNSGGLGNRLGGPSPPKLQWIQGPAPLGGTLGVISMLSAIDPAHPARGVGEACRTGHTLYSSPGAQTGVATPLARLRQSRTHFGCRYGGSAGMQVVQHEQGTQ